MNAAIKAAFVVIVVAIAAYVAWTLLKVLIVPVLVFTALVLVFKLAFGGFSKPHW